MLPLCPMACQAKQNMLSQAKTKEFNEWERSMAIRRSQGLFFKSLHQLKNHQRASTPRDQQQVQHFAFL